MIFIAIWLLILNTISTLYLLFSKKISRVHLWGVVLHNIPVIIMSMYVLGWLPWQ